MIRHQPRSPLFPYTTLFRSPTDEARRRLEEEIGDLLFAMVNLARLVKANPEEALRGAANRFAERVAYMEEAAKRDRKSTRLNSSHSQISHAVFCLKKKN